MKKDFNYPSTYEIEEVLSEMTTKKFVLEFAQKRGVIITRANQFEIATELANLYYEDLDIKEIRDEAYNKYSNHTLSAFLLKSKDSDFDLTNFYEKIRTEGLFKKGYTLSQLRQVNKENETNKYKGNIEYIRRKPGRIELLQEEKGSFDFYMHQIEADTWQIEVDCVKSNESKELKEIFSSTHNRKIDFESIEQNSLSTEKTISFFDDLAKIGLGIDWSFKDIKQLTLRKGSEMNQNEDDESEVNKDHLSGITQAILEGRNLRDNIFVVQSVEAGYKFTSMTFEYENLNQPLIIQVKAEFKGRPKVFETSIINFVKSIGTDGKTEDESLSANDNMKYRSIFWNNAKQIYDKLKQ